MKTSKSKKTSESSKLISIRIPEKMIDKLRKVAGRKGDMGYQRLIRAYLADSLSDEESQIVPVKTAGLSGPDGTEAAKKTPRKTTRVSAHLAESLKAIGTPAVSARPRRPRTEVTDLATSEIVREDIRNLARNLKPHWPQFAGKTFLITGAYGFLGKYMVYLLKYLNDSCLKKKASALLLDNFVTGYEQPVVSDENLLFCSHNVIRPFETDAGVDYIIHAAGIASPAYYTKFPIETMDVGTIGTRNMLDLAHQKNVKSFLFTSSSEVYGDPDSRFVPTNESYFGNVSITGPRACYDESKRFGETMCVTYAHVFKVPVKIVRPFNVYGPGIRPDDYRVLPNFIEHALRKEPIPIHGKGENTRSFCYINDALEAIFKILFSDFSGEAFNIGNPTPEISVKDLALLVAKMVPNPIDVVHIDPPHAVYASSDPKRRCPDITKLKTWLGFEPRYSLEDGLKRTIRWFCSR